MATILTIDRLKIDMAGSFNNDDALAPNKVPLALSVAIALAQGTGAGKASKILFKRYSIAALATQAIDVNGATTDPQGGAIAMTKARFIVVYLHASPAAVSLLIGGHATASMKNWIVALPDLDTAKPQIRCGNGPTGGVFVLTKTDSGGFGVTPGTGDQLPILNEDAALAATVDVAIVGE